jgi:hypothetical protein
LFCQGFAHMVKRLQQAEGRGLQFVCTFYLPDTLFMVSLRRRVQRQGLAVFEHDSIPFCIAQLLGKCIAQVKQVVRIILRVVEHFRLKGTGAPICALIFFVDKDAQVFFEQSGQPDVWLSQAAGSQHRVEKVQERKTIIPLQASQVVIASMKYFLNALISEQAAQCVQRLKAKRIHHEITGTA